MAKKAKPKNKLTSKKYAKYEIKDGKISSKPSCPKCGAGVFLAEHKDRLYCGKCHYVEMKAKKAE
ncbi:30S ribosomal protein S27ae [archaeon]|jgi:ubiquitin-small subunit ribosomal protein S27Ae|nr:30S ribosomal protein S27ae [archaeon]